MLMMAHPEKNRKQQARVILQCQPLLEHQGKQGQPLELSDLE